MLSLPQNFLLALALALDALGCMLVLSSLAPLAWIRTAFLTTLLFSILSLLRVYSLTAFSVVLDCSLPLIELGFSMVSSVVFCAFS